MRSRSAAANRSRVTIVVALTATMIGTGQTGAFAVTAADDSMALDLAAPVGIGAVALGVVGILLGILRQKRRAAETAQGAADPNARIVAAAATAPNVRTVPAEEQPVSAIAVDPAEQPVRGRPVTRQRVAGQPVAGSPPAVAWPAAEWPEPGAPARQRGSPRPSPARRPVPRNQPARQAERDWFAPAKPADTEALPQSGASALRSSPQARRSAARLGRTHS